MQEFGWFLRDIIKSSSLPQQGPKLCIFTLIFLSSGQPAELFSWAVLVTGIREWEEKTVLNHCLLRGCSNLLWFQLSPRICFSAEASWSSIWCSLLYCQVPGVWKRASRILCLKDTSDRNGRRLIRQKQQRPATRSSSYFSTSIGQQAWTTKKPK